MAELNLPERLAILTRVNPSGDVLEDIRAGAREPREQTTTDHQLLDTLFARLRDDDGEPHEAVSPRGAPTASVRGGRSGRATSRCG